MLKKFFVVLMAMVCICSLCLVGCGNGVPKVFAGEYEKLDNTQIDSLLTDISEKQGRNTDLDFSKGIDMSIKIETDGELAGQSLKGKMEYALKTKVVDDGIVLSGKIKTDIGAQEDAKMDMEVYYADGYSYVKTNNLKVKAKTDVNDILGQFDISDISLGEMGSGYDFKTILEQVKDLNVQTKLELEGSKIKIDKAEASIDKSGDQTKIKVDLSFDMEMELLGTKNITKTKSVFYYLFDKDYKLVGMYVDGAFTIETTVQDKTIKTNAKMNISAVPFDGDIKAPSDLTSYVAE